MKRIIIAAAVLACFALNTRAALDTYALCQHIQVLDVSHTAVASSNDLQTVTGSAVDTIDCKGYGTLVVSMGAPMQGNTNYIGVVVIQRAAASTGTWATVTNTTGTVTHTGNTTGAVTRLPYEFGAGGRYIRAVFTTTNDAAGACVTLNSFK